MQCKPSLKPLVENVVKRLTKKRVLLRFEAACVKYRNRLSGDDGKRHKCFQIY